ncbi:hemolysin-III related-domain-containing protein [Fusarium oxysporum f. sp. albedinis]|nr:hemolysin-III related-domain-containing protein [Fusarium oxysporum f. sp. albedinis]
MADTQPYGVRNRRPSVTDNLINAAKNFESKFEQSLLILWDDLPAWRRDNAFILSGYRQSHGSYAHSFRSLFYLHNESVNIWSHLLGAIVFLASAAYVDRVVRPRYESASSADVLVFACFFGGAVWGNKLDYTGIVALIVGSYVPALYYGFFCLPNLMVFYLWVICILGLGCTIVSWVERFRTPAWRPYRAMMFIGLGLSGVVPVIHGLFIYGYQGLEDRMSLSWVLLHGVMYIFGAVLYAVCPP